MSRKIAVIGLLVSLGCGDSAPTVVASFGPLHSVEVSPSQASVTIGGSLQLSAVPRDSAGNALAGKQISWSTSDPARATVNGQGLVSGLTAGPVTITATVEGKTGNATVTVLSPGQSLTGLQLVMLSYLGGSGREAIRDIAADAAGNVFFAGSTESSNFPVTNAFDGSFAANSSGFHDAFVGRLSPSGQLVWLSYLGSSGFERIYALELAPDGSVVVAGRAGPGFPVTAGAFQTTFGGGLGGATYGDQDGFVCKLRANGTGIVFCSYFGDTDGLAIRDVDVDAAGDIYVLGGTRAGTFPSTWFTQGFQKQKNGGEDVVVAKIRGDGSRVIWATYVGGSSDDIATGTVRVAGNGEVYAFFGTRSSDLPTPGGFDNSLNGASDFYLAKIAADGSRLVWATYLGGSGAEISETHAMELDPRNGEVVVAAGTQSPDFPTTTGVIQRTFGGNGSSGATGAQTNYNGDAFITRIAPDAPRIIASTYIGGSGGDGAEGVNLDAAGNIYLSGTTYSSNFPTTASIPQAGTGLRGDAFAVKVSPDLRTLIYSVRLGGSREDWGRASFVDSNGAFYLGGEIESTDMPTLNALQPQARGNWDAVFAKFIPGGS
jgi:hypothetical protein